MQYSLKNNLLFSGRFFTSWIYGLLMLMVTSAIADSQNSQYSMQKAAEQSNPWALPQRQQGEMRGQQSYDYGQRYLSVPDAKQSQAAPYPGNTGQHLQDHQWRPQADRFVSPKFLESLKQQQKSHQVMPENQRYHQPAPQQYAPVQPGSGLPGQGSYGEGAYGYPAYGAGSVNPLYDAPAVSPWGEGPDVLYRGESFPLVPGEAVGGLPPLHVPSYGMKNEAAGGSGESVYTDENKVFNPFTFLPK